MTLRTLLAPVRHTIADWAIQRTCERVNTRLKNDVSTVLSYGEHATAATLTTLGYGFLRLRGAAFTPTCPSSDGKLVGLARSLTSLVSENSSAPLIATQVVAIPTLGFTALTCVAALTVSATDVYFRNYVETKKSL